MRKDRVKYQLAFLAVMLIISTIFNSVIIVDISRKIVGAILDVNIELFVDYILIQLIPILIIDMLIILTSNILQYNIRKKMFIAKEDNIINLYYNSYKWDKDRDAIFSVISNDLLKLIDSRNGLFILSISSICKVVVCFVYAINIDFFATILSVLLFFTVHYILKSKYKQLPQIEKLLGEKHNYNYSYVWNTMANSEVTPFLKVNKILYPFEENTKEVLKEVKAKGKIYAKISLGKDIINTGVLLIIGIGVVVNNIFLKRNLQIEDVLALFLVIPQMMAGLNSVFSLASEQKIYQGIKNRVNDTLDFLQYKTEGKVNIEKINEIVCDELFFGYTDNFVIKSLSAEMHPSEMILVKGESGKGKSTFVKLLLGLISGYKGKITINGISSDRLNRILYWRRLSYVEQNCVLLNASIRKNIILNNEFEPSRYFEVLKIVGILNLIEKLESGDQAKIQDINLSSGEKQRIALARALYKKNLDLIILDEATSAIDPKSEEEIMKSLKNFVKNNKIICVFISHNENMQIIADKVININ